jgi:hypothetical protein
MKFLPAGFPGDDFSRDLQILDPAGDVGVTRGAPGLAVILMVHGPAVEAVAGEFVHDGIFAKAGHVQIEHPRGHRRAMDEKQDRPRGLAGPGRAKPLAIDPQRHVALLRPVFPTPDFALGNRRLCTLRGYCICERPGNKAKAGALDDGASRQMWIAICHDFLPGGPDIVPGARAAEPSRAPQRPEARWRCTTTARICVRHSLAQLPCRRNRVWSCRRNRV